jgi:hypothetical protein
MSEVASAQSISLGTMRAWKSGLEQLGAEGDLELLRQVAEQGMCEGLTGVKAEYDPG